jgi:2-polyprenyl-6-methoxyphenol hydroxylase-like FAD-dependent oxidoreductase
MSEAVVVGGGLAGAAFAITLARQGRPVVVLEKTTAPITRSAANS